MAAVAMSPAETASSGARSLAFMRFLPGSTAATILRWRGAGQRRGRPVYSPAMRIASLDHLVLTVEDVDATVSFYERLGMRAETFGAGRIALRFGAQKINLHQAGAEIDPHARRPVPGSADLCFLVEDALEDVARTLTDAGVAIELGP